MLSNYRYYTGIIFQSYTYGTGEPLIKGGRYNELMKHFGKPSPAIGFAIVVDTLLMALSRQKIEILSGEEDTKIIYYTGEQRESAIREAQKLRALGHNVVLYPAKEEKQS